MLCCISMQEVVGEKCDAGGVVQDAVETKVHV